MEKLKRAQDQELKDKENQIADLTRAHERKLKEKEDQLAVMARAQALSNQRAIAAEAAMNDFLANPLAGMSVPGSPNDAKIQQLQKQIDEDKLFKGLMVNKLAKVNEEKDAEVADLKQELAKLKELLANMEAQASLRATLPQVAPTPEIPAYMEPVDLELPTQSGPVEDTLTEEELDYSVGQATH